MFCPRCATDNLNEASFCRACGADIHLVSQALTGRLPAAPGTALVGNSRSARRESKEQGPARLDKIFENIFLGLAFLAIFLGGLLFFRGGFMIWIWFIIPAFACIGSGIGWYVRYRQEQKHLPAAAPNHALGSVHPSAQTFTPPPLLARDTSEMFSLNSPTPPSITEGTTRHLDAERRTVAPNSRAESDEAK